MVHQLLGVVLFVAAWQAVSLLATTEILPGPVPTLMASMELFRQGYLKDLMATTGRASLAWFLTLLIGIPVGMLLRTSKSVYQTSIGVIDFFRSIPAFLFITVFVAIGLRGESSRLAAATLAGSIIVIDQCAQIAKTLPPDRMELARVCGGSTWFVLTRVVFFEILGRGVLPVARTSIGICFIVAIVVETLVIPVHGVGARINVSLQGLEMPAVYAFILLVGFFGWLMNRLVEHLHARFLYWGN